MRPLVVVASICLFTTSAGCLGDGPDTSDERWEATLHADRPYTIGLPLPVSSPGTAFEAWWENLTVEADGAYTVEDVTDTRGRYIQISSDGDVTLSSHAVQGPMRGNRCCAEAYLDRAWTTEPDKTGLSVPVTGGPVDVTMRYTAGSGACGAKDEYQADGLQGDDTTTWRSLAGEGGSWCS